MNWQLCSYFDMYLKKQLTHEKEKVLYAISGLHFYMDWKFAKFRDDET